MAIVVILLVAALFLGAPIFAVMLGFTAAGDVYLDRGFAEQFGGNMAKLLGDATGEKSSVLSTVPLFIFMGYVMAESRTADRVVKAAQALLGWLPGGLAIVTIFACALFTTFTGASGVTIIALGSLVMPALLKAKYDERFALGLVSGTGSVGLLFPPAVPLFVFGTVYGAVEALYATELDLANAFSTKRFIFAGIVPGLVLVGILSIYAVIVASRRKVPRQHFSFLELRTRVLQAAPELAIPGLIIGGLVAGVSIPEVASLAVVYVLFLEMVVYRDIAVRDLWRITVESMTLIGAIFIIILCASALTDYFVNANIPQRLVEWMKPLVSSKWAFLLILNVILLLVGMIMEIFSAIVVVVPLIAPLAIKYGIDPYHLGVIFLLNLELGYLTPPVGLNLFITSFKFQRPVVEVTRASLPFLGCMFIALVLVTYVPQLTVVPPAERRGRVTAISIPVRETWRRKLAVDEIRLPSGETRNISECKGLGDLDRLDCEGFFTAISACRRDQGPASECEKAVVDEYMTELAEDAEDDEDDEDDEETEADGSGKGEDSTGD